MPDSARTVATALRDSPAAALIARWERSLEAGGVLTPLARTIAPGLALGPGRCELHNGVLRIAAVSAAESAKLRQAAPRLLAALVARGFQVYEMKISVQAGVTPYPGQGTPVASSPEMAFSRPSSRGITAIETAARNLPESPLQQALHRLATTLRRRA